MKVQFRSILFALVLPAAACGGGHETPKEATRRRRQSVAGEVRDVSDGRVRRGAERDAEASRRRASAEQVRRCGSRRGARWSARASYGKAKVLLELAIKLDKKQAEPHIEMARMYIAINEKGLAIASAKKAIKLAPMSSQAWNTKGRAELNAHDYDSAIEAFSKVDEQARQRIRVEQPRLHRAPAREVRGRRRASDGGHRQEGRDRFHVQQPRDRPRAPQSARRGAVGLRGGR